MRRVRVLALAAAVLVSTGVAGAQQSMDYASISGRVTDSSGAVVPGAQVIARRQHFKSDEKPALAKRETFEEAVRNSGMTIDQQSYLLGL